MRFQLLLLTAGMLLASSSVAAAGDKNEPAMVFDPPVADSSVASSGLATPRLDAALLGRSKTTPLGEGVCFTMRTYKVKPKERLQEGESASAGYATCQMASSYRFRSAVAIEQK